MTPLEERNLVWHMLELIIIKHELKIVSEFLDPQSEDEIVFGDFITGHPMCFDAIFSEMMAELTRKLPSDYVVAKSSIIGTGDGCVGVMKIKN